MAMPKDPPKPLEEPVVPDGPTAPAQASDASADAKADGGKDKTSGGRRPYDEILAELKMVQPRIHELLTALAPLAALPDDPTKGPGEVLYILARGGREAKITCGHIRTARGALGLPA